MLRSSWLVAEGCRYPASKQQRHETVLFGGEVVTSGLIDTSSAYLWLVQLTLQRQDLGLNYITAVMLSCAVFPGGMLQIQMTSVPCDAALTSQVVVQSCVKEHSATPWLAAAASRGDIVILACNIPRRGHVICI